MEQDEPSGQHRFRSEGWRGEERRNGSGWTLGKEIFGTIIAIAPFAIAFFLWINSIDRQGTMNTLEIAHLRESRGEILMRLDKISDQMAALQTAVAKLK